MALVMNRTVEFTDIIEWLIEAQCRMHEGHEVVSLDDHTHRLFRWVDRSTREVGIITLSDVKATPRHKQRLIPEWFLDSDRSRVSRFHELADVDLTTPANRHLAAMQTGRGQRPITSIM